jgi:nucleoside-diphosphate-sugar epimerase
MPISHYGRNKLAQEELVRAWAQDRLGVSTLVARISNL